MRTFATLFLFFTVVSLHAQYVGPSLSTLRFRLYGSNARPITASDTVDYAIRNETPILDGLDDRSAFPRTEFQEEYLSIMTLADMGSTSMVAFSIVHKGDTMRVGSNTDIDSVRFTPGTYQIPLEFSARFTMSPTTGVTITPSLTEFYVASLVDPLALSYDPITKALIPPPVIAPSVRRIGCAEVRVCDFSSLITAQGITGKVYVRTVEVPPGTNDLVVTAQIVGKLHTLIARSSDQGVSWKAATWPMPEVFAVAMRFTTSTTGWVYGHDESNRAVYARTTDGGATWKHVDATPIRSWPISNMPFYGALAGKADASGGVAYKVDAVGPHINEYSLFKTVDRGATWRPLLHIHNSFAPSTIVFADPDNGYMVWDSALMRTTDGGATWRYLPMVEKNRGWPKPCPDFRVADARIISNNLLCLFGENGVVVVDLGDGP